MQSIKNLNIEDLLNKLLEEKLTSNEKEQLRSVITSSYDDKQLNELMLTHWQNLDKAVFAEEPSLLNVKMKLWSLIEKGQAIQEEKETHHKIGWQTYLIRIAAILFIPLLAYSGFLIFRMNDKLGQVELVMQEVIANPGSRVHFTLPDQTEVWLNSGSKLEYPVAMNKQKQRNVKLTGQGYFKVTHNPKHPFLVEANELSIKVLGTSFDVSNYSEDGQITSTLETGSVVLLDSRGKEVAQLVPGQQATLNKTSRRLYIDNVETELTTSWKDGRLIFRDTSMKELIKLLERWFNCSIEADPLLINSDIKYTATIQDETLGEVLQMIELSTSAKTRIKNRSVLIWAK